MSRSSKREALLGQQQHRGQAEEVVADTNRSYDKFKDQEAHTAVLEHLKESELAALDRAEAELIASNESWSPTDEQRQTRRKLEEDLSAVRRALATVRQHGDTVRVPVDRAVTEVQRIAGETAGYVDDVLKEEADAALVALVAARAEAVRLAVAVDSIAQALAHRKSFRHAESINVALNRTGWPKPKPDAAPYLQLASRLMTDPDAVVL